MARARTGSGKTAAYVLPVLHRVVQVTYFILYFLNQLKYRCISYSLPSGGLIRTALIDWPSRCIRRSLQGTGHSGKLLFI